VKKIIDFSSNCFINFYVKPKNGYQTLEQMITRSKRDQELFEYDVSGILVIACVEIRQGKII
jgi:hypothetical protein